MEANQEFLGQQLTIDFIQIHKKDLDELQVKLPSILAKSGFKVEEKNTETFDGITEILYFLNELQHIIITFIEKEEYLSITSSFINQNKIVHKITDIEVEICNVISWAKCIGSSTLQRFFTKNTHRCFLSEDEGKVFVFKQFNYLHGEQTPYQKLRVYDTPQMGRVLILDEQFQISDTLEDNYTKDLSREIVKPNTKYEHILLIGAGDLKIATYILDNFDVDKLTVCELDERVVINSRKYFILSKNLDDYLKTHRLNLVFKEGQSFLKEELKQGHKYNGIIIDNTDVELWKNPTSLIALSLFSVDFYKDIKAILTSGAAFSTQLMEQSNVPEWEKRAKAAGFEKYYIVMSHTPEYTEDTPVGIGRVL